MHQHGVKNVVSSSGTSLTAGQIRILQRYGNRIVMIYDADSAGQKAMERGMNIALEQGMEVFLMQLPDGEDPDSFVKQFGRDSFMEFKKKNAEDFVTFSIHKAEKEGRMESPGDRTAAIKSVLESIALIPEELDRQVYVQHLHQQTQKYRKGSDRELFQLLDKIIAEQQKRNRYKERNESAPAAPVPHPVGEEPPIQQSGNEQERQSSSKKKPHYEKEIIRLMLQYGERMIKFIGHNIADDHFEDEELREFYKDIIKRHLEDEEVTVQHYTNREKPFPILVGDIVLERYSVSEKYVQKTGNDVKKDRNPFKTAKYSMKPLRLYYLERKRREITERTKKSEGEEKSKLMKTMTKLQKEITRIQKISADELFDDPDFLKNDSSASISGKFEYKMKGEE
jgi:DNA primase